MISADSAGLAPARDSDVTRFASERYGDCTVQPLAGDASARQYFRLKRPDNSTVILCWYPPDVEEQLDRAMRTWRALEGVVRLPEVLEHHGRFVLQEDVGDASLISLLARDADAGARAIAAAVELLPAFHRAEPRAREINPPFDVVKFGAELEMTVEFYVERLSGLDDSGALETIRRHFGRLCAEIVKHPYVLCHRDYHTDNIFIINNQIIILDYQDTRMGPDTYDLASLLRDRGTVDLIGRPAERRLLVRYARLIDADPRSVESRYFETLLQRSLKIIGTFARQAVERGRAHYLRHIPPALDAVEECVRALPRYGSLVEVFPMRERMEGRKSPPATRRTS